MNTDKMCVSFSVFFFDSILHVNLFTYLLYHMQLLSLPTVYLLPRINVHAIGFFPPPSQVACASAPPPTPSQPAGLYQDPIC